MASKGRVEAGSAMTNQYKLEVPGAPDIFFTRVGEIESELVLADMADRTRQTTGAVNASEVEVEQYIHHATERVFMESWFALCCVGAPLHKLTGLLFLFAADGTTVKASYLLDGMILKKRGTPELAAGDDGAGGKLKWTISIDMLIPI